MALTTTTLVRRTNLNCASMTQNEFCRLMSIDIVNANNIYKDMMRPELEKMNNRLESIANERIIKEADKKNYKRESSRIKFVNSRMNEWREKQSISNKYRKVDLSFFDIDPYQGTKVSIPSACIISISDDLWEKCGRCYDKLVEGGYFKHAMGWELKYMHSMDSYRSDFRPWVEFIVNEDIKNEIDEDIEKLNNAISAYND